MKGTPSIKDMSADEIYGTIASMRLNEKDFQRSVGEMDVTLYRIADMLSEVVSMVKEQSDED